MYIYMQVVAYDYPAHAGLPLPPTDPRVTGLTPIRVHDDTVTSTCVCIYLKLTRVAAPSPRASLGRRTVCGRTEQLSAAGFEALRN